MIQRQRSGTCRRICGAIRTPRQSATAAAEKLAEQREATKRDDAADDRTDRERRDRQQHHRATGVA
jgi:Na+-translocating ferredoxin:NAD+ oxidoreductase RnfC subunit